MSDWDKLSPEQQQATVHRRKLAGHTSVAEHQRLLVEKARGDAFGEACDWLKANGYFQASAALEAVAFVPEAT